MKGCQRRSAGLIGGQGIIGRIFSLPQPQKKRKGGCGKLTRRINSSNHLSAASLSSRWNSRPLEEEPFHRECFYVTGTRLFFDGILCRVPVECFRRAVHCLCPVWRSSIGSSHILSNRLLKKRAREPWRLVNYSMAGDSSLSTSLSMDRLPVNRSAKENH